LDRLVAEREMAMIFVSHDLAIVSRMTDHALVMRSGEVVERGSIAALLSHPVHPYTKVFAMSARRLEADFVAAIGRSMD
jgi:peptide/nickel transport system ATP-binding protein